MEADEWRQQADGRGRTTRQAMPYVNDGRPAGTGEQSPLRRGTPTLKLDAL
jgi:hypothetical protein